MRCFQCFERHRDRCVPFLDQPAAIGPVVLQCLPAKAPDFGVDRRGDARQCVAPDGQHPRRREHAAHFIEKCRYIEPVQRLGDRDDVGAPGVQTASLRCCLTINDAGVWLGVRELRFAGVGGHHVREPSRQADGRLPIPGCAVPGELVPRRR